MSGDSQAPSEQKKFVGQAWPHAPQCARLVSRSISQPSLLLPLQLAKPVSQAAMRHTPAWQEGEELGRTGHSRPQLPQLSRRVSVFVSQPLLTSPSQFAKPES